MTWDTATWGTAEWLAAIGIVVGIIGIVVTILRGKLPNVSKWCYNLPFTRWLLWLVDNAPDGISNKFTKLRIKIEPTLIRWRGKMIVRVPDTIAVNQSLLEEGEDQNFRVAECAQILKDEFNPLIAKEVSDEHGRVFTSQVTLNAFNAAIRDRSNSDELVRNFRSRIAILVADGDTVVDQDQVEVPWEGPLEAIFRSATEIGES